MIYDDAKENALNEMRLWSREGMTTEEGNDNKYTTNERDEVKSRNTDNNVRIT